MLLVIIKCKNKKSIYYYFFFIINFLKNLLKKVKKLKKNIIKLTILKSPHVHKIAQQQFEQKIYKKQILFLLFNNIKLLILLKKLFNFVFQDVSISYYFFINKNHFLLNLNFLKFYALYLPFFLNGNKYKLILLKFKKHKFKKTLCFFKILNFLGNRKFISFLPEIFLLSRVYLGF